MKELQGFIFTLLTLCTINGQGHPIPPTAPHRPHLPVSYPPYQPPARGQYGGVPDSARDTPTADHYPPIHRPQYHIPRESERSAAVRAKIPSANFDYPPTSNRALYEGVPYASLSQRPSQARYPYPAKESYPDYPPSSEASYPRHAAATQYRPVQSSYEHLDSASYPAPYLYADESSYIPPPLPDTTAYQHPAELSYEPPTVGSYPQPARATYPNSAKSSYPYPNEARHPYPEEYVYRRPAPFQQPKELSYSRPNAIPYQRDRERDRVPYPQTSEAKYQLPVEASYPHPSPDYYQQPKELSSSRTAANPYSQPTEAKYQLPAEDQYQQPRLPAAVQYTAPDPPSAQSGLGTRPASHPPPGANPYETRKPLREKERSGLHQIVPAGRYHVSPPVSLPYPSPGPQAIYPFKPPPHPVASGYGDSVKNEHGNTFGGSTGPYTYVDQTGAQTVNYHIFAG